MGFATETSYGSYVDVSAPGISIWTTLKGGGYGNISGTSFSSPITVGVLALMMSVKPGLTPADYEHLLKETAVDLGPAGYDPSFGWGRVDADGAVAAAAGFVPQPDTTPPSVTIATPGADSTVSGSVKVDVTARDNIGVTQVNLHLDGAFYASDLRSPYSFYWDTTQVANGPHTLTARATDAAGNVGTSASIPVFVNNGTQTMPPSVTITSVTFGRNELNVCVAVPDNGGVAKVELYVDGQLRSTDTTTPYTFSLNIQWLPSGTHTLEARAYDAAGNVGSVQTTFPK